MAEHDMVVSEGEEDEMDAVAHLAPTRKNTRPDLLAIGIPDDETLGVEPAKREFDAEETFKFLQLICDDWGEYEAGLSIGWSPFLIKKFLADPHRAELIWAIREGENESVERAIKRTAKAGNPSAQKLWAYNKMAHRGWADRKTTKIEGGTSNEIIFSVKQALEEQTRQLVQGGDVDGIRALQEAIGLGDDIIDAEVLEE